ncbi:MAG TPA: glycosyltransferase family 39 protein [Kineosporiaceae bacterium]|nr:glycosyltransferase family 39 protein [Kineosporiaceae bacterium]
MTFPTLSTGRPATVTGEAEAADRSALRTWWIGLLPAVAMAVWCLPFAGRRSLWQDESVSWAQSTESWSELVDNLHHQDLVFAPYYAFLHVWLQVSESAAWIRLPSLVAAAATVWMVAALAERLWGSRWDGLIAGTLLAVHPSFTAWALQARPYALAALAATVSFWYLDVASRSGRPRHWVAYVAACAIGGYLHLFTLLIVPVHLLALLAGRRFSRQSAVALAGLVAVCSPLALTFGQSDQVAWIGSLTWQNVQDAMHFLIGPRLVAALLVLAVLGLAVRAAQGPAERFAVTLGLGWAIFPVVALLGVSLAHPIFQERYVVFVIPGLCFAAAGGWSAFFSSVLAVPGRIALVLAVVGVAGWSPALVDTLRSLYYIDDFQGLDRYLAADPTARHIVVSPAWVATGVAYYERDGSQAAQWRQAAKSTGQTTVPRGSGPIRCSEIRVLLRSDLSEANAVAAAQGCAVGTKRQFGYLTLITLRD